MEVTALPRVGRLDGPVCRSKAEKPRWYTAADSTTLIANPGHLQLFFGGNAKKKLGRCRTHFWGPWISPKKKHALVACFKTDL